MLLGVGGDSGEWAPDHDQHRPIVLKNGNPSTPYNMDAALRLWRSCRPAYRSHLVTAGSHCAENPAPERTGSDDMVRYMEWASEG
jgi:hypothetical protein